MAPPSVRRARGLPPIVRWRIYKDRHLDYMPWWAQPIVDGQRGDPRRFHTFEAAVEHVRQAL